MKPLIVLLLVFAMAALAEVFMLHHGGVTVAGRIAMAAMLVFTAIGHFVYSEGMAMMIPGIVPFKIQLVYVTGIIEALAAVGLLVPATVVLTGWLLILFFIMLLPANINAAVRKIDYQKGEYTGSGVGYLWFRIPLQILFIGWVYWFCLR